MQKRNVKVCVGGRSYSLTTDEPEEVLFKVVEKINRELEACESRSIGINKVDQMVLLALKCSLELETVSENTAKLIEKLEELMSKADS